MDLNAPALTTEILHIEDVSQIGRARRVAKQLALRLGFNEQQSTRVAIVATELGTNIVKHAKHGFLYVREVIQRDGSGLEIIAVDKGPGFDVANCLGDGVSSSGTTGIGLGSVLRQSQVFDAYANEQGSAVMARFYRQSCQDQRVGIVHTPIKGEQKCGDTWRIAQQPGVVSALVVDGLGHGSEAAKAAALGGDAFSRLPFVDPSALMSELNAAMAGSRGGAAAIANYDATADVLHFAGIGNIAAFLVNGSRSRGLASHPGIVGVQFRQAKTFDIREVQSDLLIMHSDGIQSRWNLRSYPGLHLRHPGVVAATIHRDFCRGHDDVTILVMAIGAMQ